MCKIMSRWLLIVFGVVQGVGEFCVWKCQDAAPTVSPAFWVAGFLLQLPGNLLARMMVEKSLWGKGLTLPHLEWVVAPLTILANLAVWFLLYQILSSLASFVSRRSTLGADKISQRGRNTV